MYVKLNKGTIQQLSDTTDFLDVTKLNNAGYKEFIPAEYEKGKPYQFTYEETETQIIQHAEIVLPNPAQMFQIAKEQKISNNNVLRDEALRKGITYKNILFDSDTDAKINLLAQISIMDDADSVNWYGMNNNTLECTKADLKAIVALVSELHTLCWTKNATIKEQINNAENEEQLNTIVFDYPQND